MKQIPTPQLVRIPDPALAPIASLAPGAIHRVRHSAITAFFDASGIR
jgi:hypothetical protein